MLFVHGHGAYLMHELLNVPVRECERLSLKTQNPQSISIEEKVLVPWQ